MSVFEGTDHLLQWGLQTGFMVSLLIGLVLIIRRPFARRFGANAAYALWSLPVIRLFMPQLTVPFLRKTATKTPIESLEIAPEITKFVQPLPNVKAHTPLQNNPASLPTNNVTSSFSSSQTSSTTTSSVEVGAHSSVSLPSPLPKSNISEPSLPGPSSNGMGDSAAAFLSSINWLQLLLILWIGVAIIWFGFQIAKQIQFSKIMRVKSHAAPDQLKAMIEKSQLSVGLNYLPEIRLSEYVAGPMVSGVVKPLIILPHDFATRFDDAQQHFALVHEMAHIKRKDLWVAFASLAFRALFWPNPLVHYAAHKLRVDQEAACDASVIAWTGGEKATHSYAQTLVYAAKGMAARSKNSNLKTTPLGLALSETVSADNSAATSGFSLKKPNQTDFDEETKA